jgi:hypothetical protein
MQPLGLLFDGREFGAGLVNLVKEKRAPVRHAHVLAEYGCSAINRRRTPVEGGSRLYLAPRPRHQLIDFPLMFRD